MGYIPPPHLATTTRPSYKDAYSRMLAAHRRSPLTSASSIIILVATDVDALCAARMLADLLKQDDVMHRIIPISGATEFEHYVQELAAYPDVRKPTIWREGADRARNSCIPSCCLAWALLLSCLTNNGLVVGNRRQQSTSSTHNGHTICSACLQRRLMESRLWYGTMEV